MMTQYFSLSFQMGYQRRLDCRVETEGTAPTYASHVHQGMKSASAEHGFFPLSIPFPN